MSYLNALRLHFSGQFQANISTVNNDPDHFDNAGFKPGYQLMQGPNMNPPNGWFNPQGDARFRLLGCKVTSAWMPSGPVSYPADEVLIYLIADSDSKVPAKLVDLDPEQQLVSEIWGMTVRITDPSGKTILQGEFEPAAFMDIWDRATGGSGLGGDNVAGATYQSVLKNLIWGDVSASAFLAALQQASSGNGLLSIKFNLDGVNMGDPTAADFLCGRIAGTIGPAAPGEPRFLLLGRQFMASASSFPPPEFFVPAGGINFFPALVDPRAGCIYLDLGNALSTASPGGAINNIGDLVLSVAEPAATPGGPQGSPIVLGTIPATGTNGYAQTGSWYAQTAGVVVLPLTPDQLALIRAAPLTLSSGNAGVSIAENPSGAFVRSDYFVYRMSLGDKLDIPVYATLFGRPMAGTVVSFALDPSGLQAQSSSPLGPAPQPGQPADKLSFSPSAITDSNGMATLSVTAGDPGTPRWVNNSYGIDGQVYGIRPAFADGGIDTGPVNQWNFISFLLWSGFTPANPVTWTDVQPIFQQYANLYPVMLRFLDMASYDDVKAHSGLLSLAFGLPVSDPNSMPVTRDLSPAKRQAILAWLQDPLPGEVPEPAPRDLAAAEAPETPPALSRRGGKAAAASRRLVLQAR
ncbi:MAG TPA: hypothetical protein VGB04_07850 [Allosphingosinicella sp.]|jgi:hypothetical protein